MIVELCYVKNKKIKSRLNVLTMSIDLQNIKIQVFIR